MNNAVSKTPRLNYYGLISQERADKFDLLRQLILNQREAIVICGDEGIGKTTFFKTLETIKEDLWVICLVQAHPELNLDDIQIHMSLAIQRRYFRLQRLGIQQALALCEQRQQKLVLILDDAALLKEGLIESLLEYALQNPIVRLVFAFTQEQLYLRSATDKALDDCYFVEIPSLTLAQTDVFVQNLQSRSDDIPVMTDKLLDQLYHNSKGIPGKIITQLPFVGQKKNTLVTVVKTFLLLGLLVIGAVIFDFHYNGFNHNILKTLPLNIVAKVSKLLNLPSVVPDEAVQKTAEPKTMQITEDRLQGYVSNEYELLQELANQCSLAFMSSFTPQPLFNVIKLHYDLPLKIVPVGNDYLLLYDFFSDPKAVSAITLYLPAQFQSFWPKQFNTLAQVINIQVFLPPRQLPLEQ